MYGGKSVDTYFHIRVWGKAAVFSDDGAELAKALRQELEENYLDAGATVGTIHMLSNADGSYGASINSLFSFSANSDENSNGTAMAHEIAHSIGGLGMSTNVIPTNQTPPTPQIRTLSNGANSLVSGEWG